MSGRSWGSAPAWPGARSPSRPSSGSLVLFFTGRSAQTGPREFPLAVTHEQRLPPEPRLQTNPREDLADLRRAEERVLDSYGWVDKDAGVVRIPIDDAMRLTVERGLPARGKP